MKKILFLILVVLAALVMAACGGSSAKNKTDQTVQARSTKQLVVYCPHPLEFINPIVTEFEKQTSIKVEVVAAGTGELIRKVIAEAHNPQGDVFWGGSLATMEPVKDYFEPFISSNEKSVIDACKNIDGNITRFTYIPSVIMVNTNLAGNIPIGGYQDMLNPALKGKIAFADPAKSSSSFEHLVNMLNAMGKGDPEKGWAYVQAFAANLGGKLLSGSSAVYKGVADGEYTVGLTFEEGAARYVAAGAQVKIIYMQEGVIFRPDCIQIIKAAKNINNAQAFVNFCTNFEIQILIVNDLNRRSVRKDVPPSKILKSLAEINILFDDPALASAHKDGWLEKFKEIYTSL